MPIFAAAVLPYTMSAIGAGATAVGGIVGAHESSNAATSAAKTQADAATKAAELQKQSNDAALQFQKEQAQRDLDQANAMAQANYGQWAAREGRISSIGQALGLPGRDIPAYTPIPGSTGSGMPASQSAAPTTTVGSAVGATGSDPVTQAVLDNYKSLGASPTGPGTGPTDYQYFVQKINETGGLTPQNSSYWFGPQGRIAKEISQAGAGGGAASPASNIASAMKYQIPVGAGRTMVGNMTPAMGNSSTIGAYL